MRKIVKQIRRGAGRKTEEYLEKEGDMENLRDFENAFQGKCNSMM